MGTVFYTPFAKEVYTGNGVDWTLGVSMIDPNKFTIHANCPHCRAAGQHAISIPRKASRTKASAVCKHCGFARAGEVERQGPDTRENLLQDISRSLRNGDLKQIIDRDTKTDVPPVEDRKQSKS